MVFPIVPVPPIFSYPGILYRIHTRCYSVQTQEAHSDARSSRPPKLSSRGGRPRHIISTLNPALLVPGDCLDLSRRKTMKVCFPTSRPGSNAQASISYERYKTPSQYSEISPFPTNCIGFLHYHRDRAAGPLEGSVRFRVTSGSAPSSFYDGHDLVLPSGCPWQILLPQLARRTMYSRIREQLLEEDLVTVEQLSQCLEIFGERGTIRPETTLFRLNQEFAVRFSGGIDITVVGEKLHRLRLSSLFRACSDGKAYFPWAGSGLACFVPSTRPQYNGRRVVHMRITKIVTPLSCTVKGEKAKQSKPEEGELLTHFRYTRAPEPWAYDIDAKDTAVAVALRILWGNSGIL
ncbi:hypothetical protein K438DRAFT_1883731 [Mycena galopus ATCC 62051]|nr:hypothetical protein K438DRAFT_1883731 [Mycena galopus ATCC 62051]